MWWENSVLRKDSTLKLRVKTFPFLGGFVLRGDLHLYDFAVGMSN